MWFCCILAIFGILMLITYPKWYMSFFLLILLFAFIIKEIQGFVAFIKLGSVGDHEVNRWRKFKSFGVKVPSLDWIRNTLFIKNWNLAVNISRQFYQQKSTDKRCYWKLLIFSWHVFEAEYYYIHFGGLCALGGGNSENSGIISLFEVSNKM